MTSELEFHPMADIFPMLAPKDLSELADDIAQHVPSLADPKVPIRQVGWVAMESPDAMAPWLNKGEWRS
jgi:hypothetical protein